MLLFIYKDGIRSGPYSVEQVYQYVAEGTIATNDFAWCEGFDKWLPLNVLLHTVVQRQAEARHEALSEPQQTEQEGETVQSEGTDKTDQTVQADEIYQTDETVQPEPVEQPETIEEPIQPQRSRSFFSSCLFIMVLLGLLLITAGGAFLYFQPSVPALQKLFNLKHLSSAHAIQPPPIAEPQTVSPSPVAPLAEAQHIYSPPVMDIPPVVQSPPSLHKIAETLSALTAENTPALTVTPPPVTAQEPTEILPDDEPEKPTKQETADRMSSMLEKVQTSIIKGGYINARSTVQEFINLYKNDPDRTELVERAEKLKDSINGAETCSELFRQATDLNEEKKLSEAKELCEQIIETGKGNSLATASTNRAKLLLKYLNRSAVLSKRFSVNFAPGISDNSKVIITDAEDGEKYTLRKGDDFCGYTLVYIGKRDVRIMKDGTKSIIPIKQP